MCIRDRFSRSHATRLASLVRNGACERSEPRCVRAKRALLCASEASPIACNIDFGVEYLWLGVLGVVLRQTTATAVPKKSIHQQRSCFISRLLLIQRTPSILPWQIAKAIASRSTSGAHTLLRMRNKTIKEKCAIKKNVRTYVRTCVRTYVRTYVCTCVRTYVRTYIRT